MPGTYHKIDTEIFSVNREDADRIRSVIECRDIILAGNPGDRLHIMHVSILVIDVIDEGKDRYPAEFPFYLFNLHCRCIGSDLVIRICCNFPGDPSVFLNGKKLCIVGK